MSLPLINLRYVFLKCEAIWIIFTEKKISNIDWVKFLGILLKFPINIQCQLHVSQKEGNFFTFLKANNNTIMKGLIHTINDF